MAPPKAQEGAIMSFAPPKLPKNFYFLLLIFSEIEFGSIPKNSGLNAWSFEFWRYPRLEPHAKLPPPPLQPATGSASDDTFQARYFTNKKYIFRYY